MTVFYLALAACFAWALGWLLYDVTWTAKGLKAGIGVEANAFVRMFVGSKPTLMKMLLVEIPLRLVYAAVAFIPTPVPHVMLGPAIALLVIAGVKSMQGARQWQWLFKNPGKTLPEMKTIWSKIVGFWG